VEGLRTLDPDAPQPFETAVEAGKLMTRSEAGKLGGRGNKAGGHAHELSRGKGMREYTLARLRRDDPELAARVERGELSANAAAVQKGWRKPPDPYRQLDKVGTAITPEQRAIFAADHVEELRLTVLAGESSPHPTVVVPLDVELAAARLRRHFAPDDRARLASLLVGGDDPP
jgi:hypothetical protein